MSVTRQIFCGDRVKKSFDLIAYGKCERNTNDITSAIEVAYKNNETDEFISPTLIGNYRGIENDDSLMMINFRADRVRELLSPFLNPNFDQFKKNNDTPLITNSLGMTEYSKEISQFMRSIFVREQIQDTLGDVISRANLKQLRLAETEKYPHVTFFFNGGSETVCPGETRIMVPSPKVTTYDLKPEMSAYEIRDAIVPELEKGEVDFVCLNFANGDMVGHTGVFEAAIKACETVDKCTKDVISTGLQNGYSTLLIADHGNCETMMNPDGSPHTAHTTNPVPIILIDKEIQSISALCISVCCNNLSCML